MHTVRASSTLGFVAGLIVMAGPVRGAQPDACALLSPEAIHQATGERVVSAKATTQVARGLRQSQCFFTLPTFANSISVTLTGPADSPPDAARKLWESWFHREKEDEDQRRGTPDPEEQEAAAKAAPVTGLGDDAFWVQSFVGNLYILKGRQFLRISLGGKAADADRRARATALATEALRRLR